MFVGSDCHFDMFCHFVAHLSPIKGRFVAIFVKK